MTAPRLLLGFVLLAFLAPSPASAATCASYSNQAEAQRAADTRDSDGDGVYCESLPCPCAGPGRSEPPPSTPARPVKPSCVNTGRVQPVGFSRTKYPRIRKHYIAAVGNGWPRVLLVNRRGTDARRDRLTAQRAGTFGGHVGAVLPAR